MKNSPISEPRFACRLVRGSLSIFGDTSTGEPRGPGASHVATCGDCRQFFGACAELTQALKRDAAREWRDAPAGLEQEIIRAVNRSARDAAPASRGSRAAWLSLAGACACAAIAVVVYQQMTPASVLSSTAGPKVAANAIDPDAMAVARAVIEAVPADLFAQMEPKAQELLQQNPLQNEVDAIAADARKAVGFLARNFLPTAGNLPASGE